MRRRNDATSARLLKLLVVLLLAIVIVGGLLVIRYFDREQNGPVEGLEKRIQYEGKTYTLRKDLETTLVIGVDTYETDPTTEAYKNGQQADFLLLVIRNKRSGQCKALHINRDTMALVRVLGVGGRVVDVREQQLALSHAYGTGSHDSCLNTVRAVSGWLDGLPIDHYMALTMSAVPKLNDFVGGVEMTLEEDFSAADPTMTKGTTLVLSGEQALTFVRARGALEDPTNLHRMENQRRYMTALWNQVAGKIEEGLDADEVLELCDGLVTDYSSSQLELLFDHIGSLEFEAIATIEGDATVGEEFMEFRADEDALKQWIVETFYQIKG